ncbi:MAG: IS110 family transposase, partial [Acidimicrobiia bacterium]
RRTQGDGHHQALRAVGNRLVGFLHGCLKTGTLYNEDTAWAHQQPATHTKAA